MQRMFLKAYAKINLGLDVVRKREDGYHDVRMIMQSISLFDRIELTMESEPGIRMETNLYYLPTDADNLAYKAAKMLMDEFSVAQGVHISLNKYIPVAAGLAGGSSDAAAVLFGINRMFRLGLTMDMLSERAVRIGADVPYCLMRGTAMAEGVGEILTPLPPAPQCYVVIAKPGVVVSTRYVYENLNVQELSFHPDIDGIKEAICRRDFDGMASRLGNVLETVTIQEYPIIAKIKAFLVSCGAVNALMSGSGPTVFGLFSSKRKAERAIAELKKTELARQVYLTMFYNRRKEYAR
jgi:4-diphosphocytidyl-2-C-methyl-D-erythritol kinase